MSLGLPESSFAVLKIERATLIYVAVCDPDDSQGPGLEGGFSSVPASFVSTMEIVHSCYSRGTVNSPRSHFLFPSPKPKGLYAERNLLPQTSALLALLRCMPKRVRSTTSIFARGPFFHMVA
jgi:hypothetical protein